MKYQYFIASRWRNRDVVTELVRKLREQGKSVYSFFEGDGKKYRLKDTEQKYEPEELMKQFESIPNWRENSDVREIFEADMNALKDSEILILLLPAGKSAHLEAGAAYGMGKKCILVGEQKETESLYLLFTEIYATIDEFIANL